MKEKWMIILFLFLGITFFQGSIILNAETSVDGFEYRIGDGTEEDNDKNEKYCAITGYTGTQKDIVIPEKIEGNSRIYIDIDHLEGKNKQVRSIHLSKNVCGIDGEPYPDYDESDWDEDVYSFFSYNKLHDLKKITVDEENPDFMSEDGILYSKDKTILYRIPSLIKGSFVVPDSVRWIKSFPENSRISDFTIGKNVKYFQFYVLNHHKYLKNLRVNKKNKYYVMKKGVLYEDNMKRVRGSMNLKGIYRMPSTVKSIAGGAFAGNDKLEKVILSEGIKALYSGSFANCKNLKEIKLGKNVEWIHKDVFYKTKVRTLTLPLKTRYVNLTGNSIRELRTMNKNLKFEDEEDFISATSKIGKKYAKRSGLKKLTFIGNSKKK